MKKTALTLVLGSLLVSGSALAHTAGDILFRAGPIHVTANSASRTQNMDKGMPEAQLKVANNTQLGLTGTYFFTDNLGLELLAATPFSHKIYANVPVLPSAFGLPANLGGGPVAKVKHLPPSLYAQYYFGDANSVVRPYLGAGINYTRFFRPESTHAAVTNLSVKKHSVGPVANAGVDVKLTDNISFNAAVWYTNIRTTAKFDTPALNIYGHEVKIKLDPLVAFAGFGVRF
ncbi:hypothetical protein A4G20_00520 [Pasteurellaceae bacterium RH1A]|nr:hypothetical protein A4G20_00520 [Pasteurellaceae bacterium RH1A]